MQLPEIQNYVEYLFHIAIKKCGNINDAEDLTQEVLLAAQEYPGQIANIKSWLSTVLNHKYYDMLRHKYRFPTISIDVVPEEMDYLVTEDSEDCRNQADVRREVAFLADKYRTVIVRHYLNGEKVQDIAESLGVPKGTVLSRLSSGREQIRKGFDEMELYERQSYQPERLEVSCNGFQGFHDEPWSLVANDLMKQNILIIAYQQPLTMVEIARALGIPTAYVENAVYDLTKAELMKQVGNKYFTDFMICRPEERLKGLDVQISLVDAHYIEMRDNLKKYIEDLRVMHLPALSEQQRRKLEYYFILHLFSSAIYTVTQRIIPSKEEFPQRPDGGRWIAVGSQYPRDFDFENYRFGKYCYGGFRGACWENFLGSKSIDLKVYDTQPDLNKYNHAPIEISDDNLAKLLYIISSEIPFESTGFDPLYLHDIPHLIECGILESKKGKPTVVIPILTPEEYNGLDVVRKRYITQMADLMEPWIREIYPKLKIDIPKHLVGRVAEFRQYSCYAIPMAFMKKAIREGDFLDEGAVPPMVFVIDR